MTTDPISDLLIRLQNASMVGRESVIVPFSKMKHGLVDILSREDYVGEITRTPSGALQVALLYRGERPVISGVKRISKPSRRIYWGAHDIRPIKHGHGLLVLSTPQGLLTGKDARGKNVGGEVLFEIW